MTFINTRTFLMQWPHCSLPTIVWVNYLIFSKIGGSLPPRRKFKNDEQKQDDLSLKLKLTQSLLIGSMNQTPSLKKYWVNLQPTLSNQLLTPTRFLTKELRNSSTNSKKLVHWANKFWITLTHHYFINVEMKTTMVRKKNMRENVMKTNKMMITTLTWWMIWVNFRNFKIQTMDTF